MSIKLLTNIHAGKIYSFFGRRHYTLPTGQVVSDVRRLGEVVAGAIPVLTAPAPSLVAIAGVEVVATRRRHARVELGRQVRYLVPALGREHFAVDGPPVPRHTGTRALL